MNSYGFLAGSYDELTQDVPYARWADYLEKHFNRQKADVRTVLDLACGTGSVTYELARRGYDLIGVDLSPDMLSIAEEKCRQLENPPLLLCQDMSRLRLLTPVDACVSCLDSVNYVTNPNTLRRAFVRVRENLVPGGMFLFDVRTPEALRAMDGQVFLDETEDAYCVWRGEFSEKKKLCTYGMDLFRLLEDGTWDRGGEVHAERAYEPEELEAYLREAGFSSVKAYGPLKMRPPQADDDRIFFMAKRN